MRLCLLLLLACMAGSVVAQDAGAPAAPPTLTYDVVSVKPHGASDGSMSWGSTPTGMRCVNCNLKLLVSMAYGMHQELISGGPGWVNHTGFDMEAKVSPDQQAAFNKLEWKQKDAMLRAVLADRFGLKTHTEKKMLPDYVLTVAPSGSKVKSPAPGDPEEMKGPGFRVGQGGAASSPGEIAGNDVEIGTLADMLIGPLGRIVKDKTGLTGKYVFDLKFASPEQSSSASASSDSKAPSAVAATSSSDSSDSAPSIFTALEEQLGLKLVPSKDPLDTLVIDAAQQPSAN